MSLFDLYQLDDEPIKKIAESRGTGVDRYKVFYKCPNRSNIYYKDKIISDNWQQ